MNISANTHSPPGKRLISAVLLLLMLLVSVPALFAAPAPVLPADAEYSQPRLAANPAGHAWGNVVPNALADYFTFVPYSAADALALGFPATCGVSEDCYTITAKSFTQPLSMAPILGPAWGTNGLLGPAGTYFGPANYPAVYGYGSGGTGWVPPQFTWGAGNTILKKAAPVTLTKGNAPATFAAFQFDAKDKGIWHFPAPSIKATKGRPVRIQWLNELPNTIIPGLDPTVDCSTSSPNCFPYNRIVTHVHGAHVGPASDGLTQAEYNPDFSNLGVKFNQSILPPAAGPPATYAYPMDQEAATIWYHDHAAGNTHLNTNMGMAGFFPITDDNEKCLQGISHPTLCPTPAKVIPTGTAASLFKDSAYELGFALQDRVFDTTGQLAMPDAPVIDGSFPSCDTTSAASRLATCSPLFMRVAHPANANSLTPAGTHLVPYDETTITDFGPTGINADAPILSTSATLEFFGNMPVVNGVVYGKYDVEPRVYRMRFLGGTDSRTWDLQLQAYDALGNSLGFIPFWQIGSEQGFLNNPVQRADMLLMPGERLDVLVDFNAAKALYPTMIRVMLNNLGTDAPYQGELLTPFNRSINIPEIMQFNLVALGATPDVPAPTALLNLRPHIPVITPPVVTDATPGVPIRRIALEEIVDQYQRIMPTIDRRGYDLGAQATEIVRLFDTEIWDIINTTADAHPMHIHQVAFKVMHRQPFTSFTPAVNDFVNGVFSQANYTVDDIAGPAVPPDPHDAGYKDTVYAPPGFVTRVIARFDLLGEYVWHCHILSHEEHDMMRPLKIVASNLNPPASLTVPLSTPNGRNTTVTVAAPLPANLVADKYYVEYKKTTDTNWTTNLATTLVQNITFPGDGIYQLRVKAVDAALSPTYGDSTYTPGSNTILVAPSDQITSPANNAVLAGTSQTFQFSTSGAYPHYLWLGTTAGSFDLGRYNVAAGVPSITATGLPLNGSTVYVRLWVKVVSGLSTEMRFNDYTFTAAPGAASGVVITSASPINTLGTTNIFTAAGQGPVGSVYDYRFSLFNGTTWSVVQNYGGGATWTMPATTPLGQYTVAVDVRTSPAVARDAVAYLPHAVVSTVPATGVTITPNNPTPHPQGTAVIFTAAGQGSTGYDYRFNLFNGTTWTMVQNYGAGATWTMPATQPAGNYVVSVDVRTNAAADRDAVGYLSYDVTSGPATGVIITPAAPTPHIQGTSVAFTAAGQGPAGSVYNYRFMLFNGTSWSLVQDYGNGATWTMPASTPVGKYVVSVDVRTTSAVNRDAVSYYSYDVYSGPATGVTVAPSLPSPHPVGTAVSFTASGQGSTNYDYRFSLYNGVSWSLVQNYGLGNVWTLPAATPIGNYVIGVNVRTSSTVDSDAVIYLPYKVQ